MCQPHRLLVGWVESDSRHPVRAVHGCCARAHGVLGRHQLGAGARDLLGWRRLGARGAAGTITFTGKFSGRMTVRDCQGGIAQLDVDIDGADTTYAGIIDAQDFTFIAPNSAGYTLAKGAAVPTVTDGGKTSPCTRPS